MPFHDNTNYSGDFSPAAERRVLSVSQLNRQAKMLLETQLPLLWVEGEISNLSQPSSGHWYFTLKDANAQIRCAMFRARNSRVRFRPAHGQQVCLRAKVSLYEGRGDYQLIVEHMEEAGSGALQRAFEELKAKLQAEGLFDPAHKRPLPEYPQRIALITSPSGAAVRDMISVFARRYRLTELVVLPVAVQGDGAAEQIARAINVANRMRAIDAIIVGRGGGSLEDLWCFNEEVVARTIHASHIPVISAVGHETDFTIADFAADVRAPTPSAAAELLSPDGDELRRYFATYEAALIERARQHIARQTTALQHLRARLRHPSDKLQHWAQQLDGLELRLERAMQAALLARKSRFSQVQLKLQQFHPQTRLEQVRQRLQPLKHQLEQQIGTEVTIARQRLSSACQRLDTVNPLNTLKRGYAVIDNTDNTLITRATQAPAGSRVRARLAEGELLCEVIESR